MTFPYLVRVLDPSNFGVLAFSFAVIAYGVLLADYGFNLSASKRIAEIRGDRRTLSETFWSVLTAKALLDAAGVAALLTATWLVPQLAAIRPVLLAATPMVLGSVLFPGWLFQGLERMSMTSAFTIGSQAIVVPLTFALVHRAEDTWLATLVRACAPAVAGIASLVWLYRERIVGWHRARWFDTRRALADGWHIFVSTAAISVYTTSNQVILGFRSAAGRLLRGRRSGAIRRPGGGRRAVQRGLSTRGRPHAQRSTGCSRTRTQADAASGHGHVLGRLRVVAGRAADRQPAHGPRVRRVHRRAALDGLRAVRRQLEQRLRHSAHAPAWHDDRLQQDSHGLSRVQLGNLHPVGAALGATGAAIAMLLTETAHRSDGVASAARGRQTRLNGARA